MKNTAVVYTGDQETAHNKRNYPMTRLNSFKAFLDRHIDYRGAVAGALILGSVVYYVNHQHGAAGATTAALKQATYTFFAGGYMMRLNERICLAVNPAALGVLAGILGAGGLAVTLTFILHSLRGTPEPFYSTVPTILLVVFGFTVLGTWTRYKLARNGKGQDAA